MSNQYLVLIRHNTYVPIDIISFTKKQNMEYMISKLKSWGTSCERVYYLTLDELIGTNIVEI